MALDQELRVRHFDPKTTRIELASNRQPVEESLPYWMELEHRTSKPTPTETHFLQDRPYSNTDTPPNSVTPCGSSFQTLESMGENLSKPPQPYKFTFPPTTKEYFLYSTSSPTGAVTFVIDLSHSDRCKMESQSSFDWHFCDG